MTKASLATVLLLIATNTAWAQFTEYDQLDSTGFVQERLGYIDTVINAEISKGKIPGAVALVALNGKLAYFKSFGFSDIDTKTPMQKDNIFRMASMTKAITSVGAMILYERGLFQLNDPVSKWMAMEIYPLPFPRLRKSRLSICSHIHLELAILLRPTVCRSPTLPLE